ncbi:hypothetical protein BGZ61DRAFT_47633 [Ilyonectria robusta]|uniref:uncharacterized protein n=1 Tax=Ilyonectria robusta TaxID=1079257 RepID=UPI001E8E9D4B|nr:uncharacterized protein BGZ61DRAFT_47633 [Ilyonectria robusta]KAH8686896.1 hypothetical protein BGZ61DRAFT_47633 [Ilyonectria robusta]
MLASLLNSSPPPTSIPAPEVREVITARLSDLVQALEAHPAWTPASPPRNLFFVWDFVKRSHYIMTELDNISNGRPIKHPEQIPPNDATGDRAAALSFQDVCTRSMTVSEMIQNPRMLVMLGLSNIDFSDDVRQKSRALSDAITNASSSSS